MGQKIKVRTTYILQFTLLTLIVNGIGCSIGVATQDYQDQLRDFDADSDTAIGLEQEVSDAATLAQTQGEFKPPYPNRTNPFHRPSSIGSLAGVGIDSSEQGVRLKGFVNVDGEKTLLVIDGRLFVLAENQEVAGVRVLDISQPNVIYTRDGAHHSLSLRTGG